MKEIKIFQSIVLLFLYISNGASASFLPTSWSKSSNNTNKLTSTNNQIMSTLNEIQSVDDLYNRVERTASVFENGIKSFCDSSPNFSQLNEMACVEQLGFLQMMTSKNNRSLALPGQNFSLNSHNLCRTQGGRILSSTQYYSSMCNYFKSEQAISKSKIGGEIKTYVEQSIGVIENYNKLQNKKNSSALKERRRQLTKDLEDAKAATKTARKRVEQLRAETNKTKGETNLSKAEANLAKARTNQELAEQNLEAMTSTPAKMIGKVIAPVKVAAFGVADAAKGVSNKIGITSALNKLGGMLTNITYMVVAVAAVVLAKSGGAITNRLNNLTSYLLQVARNIIVFSSVFIYNGFDKINIFKYGFRAFQAATGIYFQSRRDNYLRAQTNAANRIENMQLQNQPSEQVMQQAANAIMAGMQELPQEQRQLVTGIILRA